MVEAVGGDVTGELVPAFEVFDAVSAGDADIYHAAEYYWQGKSKAYSFFTAVPFGLTGRRPTAGSCTAVARSCGMSSPRGST